MKIKFIILSLLLFLSLDMVNAQVTKSEDWNYKGNSMGKDIEFVLKISDIKTTKAGSFFWITGNIIQSGDGYIHLNESDLDIKTPKNSGLVKCVTFEEKKWAGYKQWSSKSNPIPMEHCLKFEILPGFKKGDIEIDLKLVYNTSTNETPDLKPIMPGKGKHTFSIKNVPPVLTLEQQQEQSLKDLDDRYASYIKDTILKENKEIEEQLKEIESSIAKTDNGATATLKTLHHKIGSLNLATKKHLKNLQTIEKIANAIKKESKFAEQIKEAIATVDATASKIAGKTLLGSDKIKGIEREEKKKLDDNIKKVKANFLPKYENLQKVLNAYIPNFKEFKTKLQNLKVELKNPNNTIPRNEATLLDEEYLQLVGNYEKTVAEKQQLDDDYNTVAENFRSSEIDESKKNCETNIDEINSIKKNTDKFQKELQDGGHITTSRTWIYWLIGIILTLSIGGYFAIQFLKKKKKKDLIEAENNAIASIEIDIEMDNDSVSRGLITDLSEINIDNFAPINMSEQWQNSFVKTCYISKNAIDKIYDVCRTEQRKKGKEDKAPEMGGFLLGRYFKHNGNEELYDLFIENYEQPTETEHQDIYQIKFGTKAMHDLDNALNKNPKQALVGWFHTHPGHGPFLSQPDLNIHNGTFTEKHQVAIVIDPYHEYDTGIFSRYQNKERKNQSIINNKGQKKWFSWDKLKANKMLNERKSNLPASLKQRYYEVELKDFWANSSVAKVYIAYDIIFDFEKLSRSNHEKLTFNGYIDGYYDETEAGSGIFNIYLKKLTPDNLLWEGDQVGWVGCSNEKMQELENRVIAKHKDLSENKWDMAVILSDNGKKISFFSQKNDGTLNFASEGNYYVDFDKINKWTMT